MSAIKKSFAIAIVFAVPSMAAIAQEQGHLRVETTVQKQVVVETEDGSTERKLVQADSVIPGETVVYTITFSNVGDEPADNVVITNPISASLTYVAGSASNGEMVVEFSIDGGQTFAPASQLKIVDNGVERPATTRDYTHVRWAMQSELAVGGEGQTSFAAVLE